MQKTATFVTVTSLALLGSLLESSPASADWYVRQHASECYVTNSTIKAQAEASGEHHGLQNLTSSNITLACPFPDTSVSRKDTLSYAWLGVKTYSAANPVQSKNCRADLTGQTGACSPTSTTTAPTVAIHPNAAYWGVDRDSFAYTFITVFPGAEVYGLIYGGT
jgi:hypothetical protein